VISVILAALVVRATMDTWLCQMVVASFSVVTKDAMFAPLKMSALLAMKEISWLLANASL